MKKSNHSSINFPSLPSLHASSIHSLLRRFKRYVAESAALYGSLSLAEL